MRILCISIIYEVKTQFLPNVILNPSKYWNECMCTVHSVPSIFGKRFKHFGNHWLITSIEWSLGWVEFTGPWSCQTWVFHIFGWVFHKFTENGEFYLGKHKKNGLTIGISPKPVTPPRPSYSENSVANCVLCTSPLKQSPLSSNVPQFCSCSTRKCARRGGGWAHSSCAPPAPPSQSPATCAGAGRWRRYQGTYMV